MRLTAIERDLAAWTKAKLRVYEALLDGRKPDEDTKDNLTRASVDLLRRGMKLLVRGKPVVAARQLSGHGKDAHSRTQQKGVL